jgi:serine protease inhibitor
MELGLALLERLEGDVVLSPYGLARALSVIREGSTGETRAALDAVVAAVPEVEGIVSAQAAWLGAGYAPGPALTLETGPLDVDRANAWSNEKTHGMIPRIVDAFADDEIFALTDAEYLDAKWVFPFDRTRAGLMGVDGTFEHTEDAIRLPYRDGELRFVAMMGVAPETWTEGYGTVELPRFSTTSSLELAEPLIDLGLGPAFNESHDLDALVLGPGKKALKRILQRARVDVDEAGTRAAATTAITMRAVAYREPTFHIVFDRPFTWAVEHAPTGTLLFVGRVLNPTERSD